MRPKTRLRSSNSNHESRAGKGRSFARKSEGALVAAPRSDQKVLDQAALGAAGGIRLPVERSQHPLIGVGTGEVDLQRRPRWPGTGRCRPTFPGIRFPQIEFRVRGHGVDPGGRPLCISADVLSKSLGTIDLKLRSDCVRVRWTRISTPRKLRTDPIGTKTDWSAQQALVHQGSSRQPWHSRPWHGSLGAVVPGAD